MANNSTELWLPSTYTRPEPTTGVDLAGRPANIVPSRSVIGRNAIQSLPTQERVARANTSNGWWNSYRNYLEALPRPTDDLDRELDYPVLERMMQDAQINSSVHLIAMAAMSRGLKVKPRINDPEHKLFEVSQKVQYFIEHAISHLGDSTTSVFMDMLIACLTYGHTVAEQTYELCTTGEWSGKLILKSLKTKHPKTYSFVVDKYGNVPYIAAYTGKDLVNAPSVVKVDDPRTILGLPADWELIPSEKFAVMTHRKKFNDPRGQSILRPAYGAWHILMQIWPEYLKYLCQFASPSVVGIAPEKGGGDTDPVTGDIIDPVDMMFAELLAWMNGTVLALRYGSEVKLEYSNGDGTAFVNAINVLNSQMVKAILHQLLATEEGKHQARAAASTHQDVLNVAVRAIKGMMTSMIHRQIFKPLVEMNFGEQVAELLTPYCSLGDIAPEDRNATIEAMSNAGYVMSAEQAPSIDAELELVVRTPEQASRAMPSAADVAEQQAQIAADQAKAAAAAKPATTSGQPGKSQPSAKPAAKRANAPKTKAQFMEQLDELRNIILDMDDFE